MNQLLLDPFVLAQEYPETLSRSLSWGHATALKFNRKGDYLASGLLDGTIIIFDFDTSCVIATLKGHVRPIQNINWSRNGRYLLTSSRDWLCILWDLSAPGKTKTRINLGAPVWSCSMHPTDEYRFSASLYEDSARVVSIGKDKIDMKVIPTAADGKTDKHLTLVTLFSRNGDYILTGTSKGYLNVISAETLEIVRSFRITTSNIKNLAMSESGRFLVANSSDRVIRLISLPDFTTVPSDQWEVDTVHKFQDVVNRLQWNMVAISASGEYILASTYESAHDIYMWESTMGSLVKIYEGPKEEIVDVTFHPTRPLIAATGLDTGAIYIWTYNIPQKWSALAPDFVELEENVVYEEKEDEFDIVDDAELDKRQLNDEEEEVDIVTIEKTRGEYGENSFVIPMNLLVQEERPILDSDED